MAAITWRNIDAPDLRGSMQGMVLAQRGFQQGLDSLQGILDQQAKTEQANWEQQKRNNTDELKNLLFNAKTPEEATAIQSQIAERLTAMGAQVDANAVRTAADARVPELQRRALDGIDYNNKQTDAKDAPILNRLNALALQDPIQAAAELNGAGLSDRGRLAFEQNLRKLTEENVNNERGNTRFKWEGDEQDRKERKFKDDLLTNASQRNSNAASARLSGMQARRIEEEILNGGTPAELKAARAKEAEGAAQIRKEMMAQGGWGGGKADGLEGDKSINASQIMKDLGPENRQEILQAMGNYIKNGVPVTYNGKTQTIPLSADLIVAAVNATGNRWVGRLAHPFDGSHATDAMQWITDTLGDPNSSRYNPETVKQYLTGYAAYLGKDPELLLPKPSEPKGTAAERAKQEASPTPPPNRPELPRPSLPEDAQDQINRAGFKSLYRDSPSDLTKRRLLRQLREARNASS